MTESSEQSMQDKPPVRKASKFQMEKIMIFYSLIFFGGTAVIAITPEEWRGPIMTILVAGVVLGMFKIH